MFNKKITHFIAGLLFITIAIYTSCSSEEKKPSSSKEISKINITGQVSYSINELNILVHLPFGSTKKNLAPEINHSGVSITPSSGESQDFTKPVKYTVTAENGSTQIYTVTVQYPWGTRVGMSKSDSPNDDSARALCRDSEGNIYFTGSFVGTPFFGSTQLSGGTSENTFLAKCSPDGDYLWVKKISTSSNAYECGYSVCVDSDNNVYIAGTFSNSITFNDTTYQGKGLGDIFIAKYSTDGTFLWAETFGDTMHDYGYAVCTDSYKNVYLAGGFTGTINFGGTDKTSNNGTSDIFVLKLNSAGVFQWEKIIADSGHGAANALCVDSNNNICVTGSFTGTADFGSGSNFSTNYPGIFIAQYSSSGNYIWAVNCGGAYNWGADRDYPDTGYSICTDTKDNIILCGRIGGKANFGGSDFPSTGPTGHNDIFIAKYSSSGVYHWVKTYSSPSNNYDNAFSVCTDSADNVYMTGSYYDSINFGDNSTALNSNGSASVFITKFSAEGTCLSASTYGYGSAYGYAIAIDQFGYLYVAGSFGSTSNYINFGGGNVQSAGGHDLFIMKQLIQ